MRKALLIVALLLLVTPVMAATTITAVKEGAVWTAADGNKVQTVRIDYSGVAGTDVNVRAFALDINIDAGPTFRRVRNFKTGESNAASPGYGIFPSRFRDFVNVTTPNWVDTNYNPTTAWNERGAQNTGMGFPRMVTEMGTLYDPNNNANRPALSGTLFRFDVNSEGNAGTFNLSIKADTIRGGVVNNDGNNITGAVFVGTSIDYPCAIPSVVGQPEATATAAIVAAGFTIGTRTATCGGTAGNVVSTTPGAGDATCGISVAYLVADGTSCCTTIPAFLDHNTADANAHITAVGLTVGTIGSECNATYAVGRVCRQDTGCITSGAPVNYWLSLGVAPGVPASITVPATGTLGVQTITWTAGTGATSYVLESNSPSSGTTIFPSWVQIYSGTALTFTDKVGGGTWMYRVKSRNVCADSAYRTGSNSCVDVNSLTGGVAGAAERTDWMKWRYPACWSYKKQCRADLNGKKTGTIVSSTDFTAFVAAFGKTDALVAGITTPPFGICADLNHKKTGTRVSSTDFTILTTYFGKPDVNVPDCNAAPIINGPWTYWTTP